jgi:CHASE2 domain-containing sensor protein
MASPEGSRFGKYGDKLLDAAILLIPNALITGWLTSLQKATLDEPWRQLWIVPPLSVLTWFLYRWIRRERTPLRHWRWGALFAAFMVLFVLAALSDGLRWSRAASQGDAIPSREWLLPLRAGDWHYRFARPAAPESDVLRILQLEPGTSIDALRRTEAEIIRLAAARPQADAPLGIAFDVYFVGTSPADEELCAAISATDIPVLSGYTYRHVRAGYVEYPDKPPLPCQQRNDQGHLLGYADADGLVRALRFTDGLRRPSFSTRIAQRIAEARKQQGGEDMVLAKPTDNFLRYLPPPQDFKALDLADLRETPGLLNNRYLLVGLKVPGDQFATPFGDRYGSMIQAYAVHSLLTGHFIRRPSPVYSAAMIISCCGLLMLLAIQQRGWRLLVGTAVVLNLAMLGLAAASMYFWMVWLDVVYAAAALWLWTAVLLAARRGLQMQHRSAPLTLAPDRP